MTGEAGKKRIGRPPVADSDKHKHPFVVRLNDAQKAKVEAAGGAEWVRSLIDKARPPKAAG